MSLKEHRSEVQKIDEEIIRLINDRIKLAEMIFAAKRAEGLGIDDPTQEKLVLERAVDLATELNLDAGTMKSIFELVIQMSLQRQHELLGEGNLP